MERVRNNAFRFVRGILGLALISEALIIGVDTADHFSAPKGSERGLVFAHTPPQESTAQDHASNYDIADQEALNIIAIAGLASGGIRLLRGTRLNTAGAETNN